VILSIGAGVDGWIVGEEGGGVAILGGIPADESIEGVRVITEDWPIVVVEYPAERVSDSTHREVLACIEDLMMEAVERREKLFFVTDLTSMRQFSPASHGSETARWIERTSPLARAASVGAAHVTPSAILRGLIAAVFLIHRPPTPSVFVATRREAILRGIQMLEDAHEPLPPRLLALRSRR
jgi:hypothetical protein